MYRYFFRRSEKHSFQDYFRDAFSAVFQWCPLEFLQSTPENSSGTPPPGMLTLISYGISSGISLEIEKKSFVGFHREVLQGFLAGFLWTLLLESFLQFSLGILSEIFPVPFLGVLRRFLSGFLLRFALRMSQKFFPWFLDLLRNSFKQSSRIFLKKFLPGFL